MTPRDVDVAYVLEDVPGIFGVYAVRGLDQIRYAIRHEENGQTVARMHYALLRILTYEECASVAFYRVEIPPVVRAHATRLVLSPFAREQAHARVPLTTPALEQTLTMAKPVPTTRGAVLIVDDDPGIAAIAEEAFGTDIRRDIIADPFTALWEAKARHYDLILCDVDRAYGNGGFVSNLALSERKRALKVLLLAWPGQLSSLENPRFEQDLVHRPVTIANLRAAAQRAASKAAPSKPRPPRPKKPSVLVIDENARALTNASFTITPVRDAWEALERIQEDWALVICSLTMKTSTGSRLYSLLWKSRPDIKRRFALLVDHPDGANRVLARPLTADAVTAMLDTIGAANSAAT